MTVADPEILNALKWSHELDKVFRENYEEDKEILWQYFGSQTGFMRSFPGLLLQLDKYLQVAMLESCRDKENYWSMNEERNETVTSVGVHGD